MLGMPSPWAVRLITAKQMLPEQTHPGLGYLGLQCSAGVTSSVISPEELEAEVRRFELS